MMIINKECKRTLNALNVSLRDKVKSVNGSSSDKIIHTILYPVNKIIEQFFTMEMYTQLKGKRIQ